MGVDAPLLQDSFHCKIMGEFPNRIEKDGQVYFVVNTTSLRNKI